MLPVTCHVFFSFSPCFAWIYLKMGATESNDTHTHTHTHTHTYTHTDKRTHAHAMIEVLKLSSLWPILNTESLCQSCFHGQASSLKWHWVVVLWNLRPFYLFFLSLSSVNIEILCCSFSQFLIYLKYCDTLTPYHTCPKFWTSQLIGVSTNYLKSGSINSVFLIPPALQEYTVCTVINGNSILLVPPALQEYTACTFINGTSILLVPPALQEYTACTVINGKIILLVLPEVARVYCLYCQK